MHLIPVWKWGELAPKLCTEGAIVVPCMTEAGRKRLLSLSRKEAFVTAPEQHGARQVEQHFSSTPTLSRESFFGNVAVALEKSVEAADRRLRGMLFKGAPFRVDELYLQRYNPCRVGIARHRDYKSNRYLVTIVVLEGVGEFTVFEDMAGNGARHLYAKPGDAILMRMPGLFGTTERPIHEVGKVTSRRTALVLRHVAM